MVPCLVRAVGAGLLGLAVLLAAAGSHAESAALLGWRVVAAHPHDASAFTQGLVLHDGLLYESTGLRGRSQLRRVDPASGRVLLARDLEPALFGEGLARVDQRLYQLTWQAGRGFIYSTRDLRRLGEFNYPGEGWGLVYDGKRLFMSDGSDRLRIIDPQGFVERGRIAVHDHGSPVAQLNELEFVRGSLFANVWRSDRIARIDPSSGRVTGWLDLSGLRGPLAAGADVLNGIAYDDATDRLWVTGKLWPRIFVLEVDD